MNLGPLFVRKTAASLLTSILLLLLISFQNFSSFRSNGLCLQKKQIIKEAVYDPQWDDLAIALKTGKEVALERVPIQLLTFLADVRNKIIIGDGNATIGEYQMIDVVTDLYHQLDKSIFKRSHVSPDAVIPNQNSEGWKSDAHKNLPGLGELYKAFPKAKWYIMIDDDTYLLKHNLVSEFKKYDHSIPHYFGAATAFVGCDGVFDFQNSPRFAHGGAGIVLSHGAMKLLIPKLDKCIMKYKSCWAGDVRTALCLRDVGVTLQTFPGFHKEPPNEKFSFAESCHRPISFHHLLLNQIQTLSDLEKEKKDSDMKITLSDIYHRFIKSDDSIKNNTDRIGHDMFVTETDTYLNCSKICKSLDDCASFSYDGSRCWLKNGIPPSVISKKGFYSGVLSSNYLCKI